MARLRKSVGRELAPLHDYARVNTSGLAEGGIRYD